MATTRQCEKCDGKGSWECQVCLGEGYGEDGDPCVNCHDMTSGKGQETCDECEGLGFVDD